MKLQVFSIRDAAAEIYQTPFCTRSKGEALRVFQDLANDQSHPVGQHPEDYCLFHIGEYNQDTAEMIPAVPNSMGLAVEFSRSEKQAG